MGGPQPDIRARRPAEEDPGGIFSHGGVFPGVPRKCPNCGEPAPEAVIDESRVNFLCRRCGTCWHMAMGFIWPTGPLRRPG